MGREKAADTHGGTLTANQTGAVPLQATAADGSGVASNTLTIVIRSAAKEALEEQVKRLEKLLADYPDAFTDESRAALQTALDEANALLRQETAPDADYTAMFLVLLRGYSVIAKPDTRAAAISSSLGKGVISPNPLYLVFQIIVRDTLADERITRF